MSSVYKGGKKAANARWYAANREEQCFKMKQRREFVKALVYRAYGGYICACCGETDKGFLSIDHINNDGAAHRKMIGNRGGIGVYYWLYNNNFPPGFQILCYNCNLGRARNNGICPHKDKLMGSKFKANPLGSLMGELVWNGVVESGSA